MKSKNKLVIICFLVLLVFTAIIFMHIPNKEEILKHLPEQRAIKYSERPTYINDISFKVTEEEYIPVVDYNGVVWSKPEQRKSSRMLYYITEKIISGERKNVLVSKMSGEEIVLLGGWLTINKQAYIKAEHFDESPYLLYGIYDFKQNLLSKVEFKGSNKYLESYESSEGVQPWYFFDNGAFGGINAGTGKIHLVNPSNNIYKEVPIFNPAVPIDYDAAMSGDYAFNPVNKEIFILIRARSHRYREDKKDVYVGLYFDENGNVLWRREKPTQSWSIMSPEGNYIVLYTEERGKSFEGEAEIINRNGNTVSTIKTAFSISRDRFSEDMKIIGFGEEEYKINFYEINTGKQLCTFSFNGEYREFEFNSRKKLIYILCDGLNHYYLNVYSLKGGTNQPLWVYDLGTKDNINTITSLSVSKDGNEITAYANGILRILNRVKCKIF